MVGVLVTIALCIVTTVAAVWSIHKLFDLMLAMDDDYVDASPMTSTTPMVPVKVRTLTEDPIMANLGHPPERYFEAMNKGHKFIDFEQNQYNVANPKE